MEESIKIISIPLSISSRQNLKMISMSSSGNLASNIHLGLSYRIDLIISDFGDFVVARRLTQVLYLGKIAEIAVVFCRVVLEGFILCNGKDCLP